MPRIDQKNASNPVSLVEIEYVSETHVLYFQSVMHFSGSTICTQYFSTQICQFSEEED